MRRRSPYWIGRDHGYRHLPRYAHRANARRYDSANANATYEVGYGEGIRLRLRDATLPLFQEPPCTTTTTS